jgi:hypothetical protein
MGEPVTGEEARALTRHAAVIAMAATVAALAVAIVIRVGWAPAARRTLGFAFAGVPARVGTAASILAANGRLLLAVLAAVLVAQSPWLPGLGARPGPVTIVLRTAIDVVLVLAVAANVGLVGAALGAYGMRMLVAMLPHGPLELAAFATALALYRDARRGPLPLRRVLTVAGGCLAALSVAALMETFLVP